MNEELKPCPFCGGEAKYFDSSNEYEDSHEGCCQDKTCTYSLTERGTKEAACKAWNTRHTEEQSCWISVEDRLPDEKVYYLGVAKRGDGELYVGMWPWEGESFGYYVKLTHWQPLPSPPEATKDKA